MRTQLDVIGRLVYPAVLSRNVMESPIVKKTKHATIEKKKRVVSFAST